MNEVGRYRFADVFNTSAVGVIPTVRVMLNGALIEPNTPIVPQTREGQIIYRYIGRDMSGLYDQVNQTLTILGFYA